VDGGGSGGECALGPTLDPMTTPASAGTGTVQGKVKWSGSPAVPAGRAAAGDLYIAVVETFAAACPDRDAPPVAPAAQTLLRCADFGAGGEIDYAVHGVPVGTELYVVPFLDVDRNVDLDDPVTAGPNGCDLAGTGAKFTIASTDVPADVDVDLIVDGAFLGDLCGYPDCTPE